VEKNTESWHQRRFLIVSQVIAGIGRAV